MPLRIDVHGLPDRGLKRLADGVSDLRPFWAELGERLADEAQARWPLRRRSGKLRESLRWAGNRLGPGGVFDASPDRLTFGSSVFYSRFAQFGTRKQRATPLIHVDADDASTRLGAWAKARAEASGLEIT